MGNAKKAKDNIYMKKTITLFILTLLWSISFADIAPNPIIVKGIFTTDSCRIRMVSETVVGDLYNDSAKVECTFEMLNYSDSITIDVGFPEMNFQYWAYGEYDANDKQNFKVYVDNKVLSATQIGVPSEMNDIYNAYMSEFNSKKTYEQKFDSVCKVNHIELDKKGNPLYNYNDPNDKKRLALDSLRTKTNYGSFYIDSDLRNQFVNQRKKGNFPWYMWRVHFDRNEKKYIKVVYSLPAGFAAGKHDRYFNYILRTGAGWYQDIERADIILNLHGIQTKNLKQVNPAGSVIDNSTNTIHWNFKNLEPTEKDDIYVRYSNPRKSNATEIQILKRKMH